MSYLSKKTVEDLNVAGKRVLVRCDFNVPLKNGVITDENRIVAALPTIQYLINNGAKVILCSHLGKPKGEPKPELSLAPVAARLSEKLGKDIVFAADDCVVGENAKAAVAAMNDGDVVLLQNTRYRAEETKNGEALSAELGSLCDLFVNDAFGAAHRAHCSTVGVASYVEESANGYLMAKEVQYLGSAVNNPNRPFVTILGGAKVADKLNVIENLLNKADTSPLLNDPAVLDVTRYHDMQELLCISDMLITDYSSSMFDFSMLKKPCIIYATDIEQYDRGYYYSFSEMPYPVARNLQELTDTIKELDLEEHLAKINEFMTDTIGMFEKGKACKEIAGWMSRHSI